MPEDATTRPRRGRAVLIWAGANLAIGYAAAFPLLTVVALASYVRYRLWGHLAGWDHDPEPAAGVLLVVVVGGPLALAAVIVNGALWRRLGLRRRIATAFWVATIAVLLAPGTFLLLGPDLTAAEWLGKGLLW